jgi:hypothetical protein
MSFKRTGLTVICTPHPHPTAQATVALLCRQSIADPQ